MDRRFAGSRYCRHFDLEIEHRKGRKHFSTDALSHRPCEPSCSICTRQEQKEDAATPVGLVAATATRSDHGLEAWIQKWKTGDWTERQADDACLQPVIQWVTDGVRPKWEAVGRRSGGTGSGLISWS